MYPSALNVESENGVLYVDPLHYDMGQLVRVTEGPNFPYVRREVLYPLNCNTKDIKFYHTNPDLGVETLQMKDRKFVTCMLLPVSGQVREGNSTRLPLYRFNCPVIPTHIIQDNVSVVTYDSIVSTPHCLRRMLSLIPSKYNHLSLGFVLPFLVTSLSLLRNVYGLGLSFVPRFSTPVW